MATLDATVSAGPVADLPGLEAFDAAYAQVRGAALESPAPR
jgi:hypothetical protein